MNRFLLLCIVALMLGTTACKTRRGLFSKPTPLEQFAQKLSDAGLRNTTLGDRWFRAYDQALQAPVLVSLPYRQRGYFSAEDPRSIGLQFHAPRGAELRFQVEKRSASRFLLYTELWHLRGNGERVKAFIPDSTQNRFTHAIDEAGTFILRLQPELLHSGEYTLSIVLAPSLAYPVPKGRVGSVWGDARDGGARRHEGIDIFAPRRSPVVACANGTISRVEETAVGGKVVWQRVEGRSLNLYYAHLDEQQVRAGQQVKEGEQIGTVGNTGNARSTSPHLHFGIYTFGGAIDPLPFVNPQIKEPGRIPDLPLPQWQRLKNETRIAGLRLPAQSIVWVTDRDESQALVDVPGTSLRGKVTQENLQTVDNQLSTFIQSDSLALLDQPHPAAARKNRIPGPVTLRILGYSGNFAYVRVNDQEGWVPRKR